MSKNETNEIKVDGNGNIILQGVHNSQITIDSSNSEDILSKLNQLENSQLDALSQIATKDDLGQLFQTLLAGFISEKNIVKGSISNVSGDVTIGDHNTKNYYFIHKENSKNSKELTLNLPILRTDQIIGREKDLEDIHERLFIQKQVVLVNGMGGIGKTTLAQVYLTKYYKEYKYILWLGLNAEGGDFEADFIRTEGLLARFDINPEGKTVRQSFLKLISALKELKGGISLFVIDNAKNNLAEYYNYLPNQPNWHLLVTSREQINYFDFKELGFFNKEEALKLFKKYYTHKKLSDAFLMELVNELEYHTLTIEILAKTAQEQRSSPRELLTAIQNDLEVDLEGVRHSGDKVMKLTSYLRRIFKISNLTENEQWLLQQFICLPITLHSYDLLEELISKKEGLTFLAKTLNSLAKKGWLLYNKDADSYKIHRIIIDVVKTSLDLEEKEIKTLIKSISSKLLIDQTKDNPSHKFKWIPYGKIIIAQFENSSSEEINQLQSNLAFVLQAFGDYEGTKTLLEKAKESNERNLGKDHPSTAASYSNLALVLQDLGDYEGAKVLLEKAKKITEKNLGEEHPSTAISYSNLALVLQDLGDYEGAKALLEKAKKITEKNLGKEHPSTAIRYSNLALVLKDLRDYEGAKILLEKAKESNEKNLGEDHPSTAVNYSNLALVLKDLKDYEGAKILLEKAKESNEKNLGEDHPSTAVNYSNLALVFKDVGNYEAAKTLLVKAYEVFKNNLGEEHPNTKIIKSNLDYVILIMNK